jgi:t-SNARE complex subunit (syntaxin)
MPAPDPPLGGRRYNPNTPEGQIESVGMFARAIGARRIKIIALVIIILAVVVMVIGAVAK